MEKIIMKSAEMQCRDSKEGARPCNDSSYTVVRKLLS